ISESIMTTAGGQRFRMRLQKPGMGVSRFSLDHMLMVRAVAAGVTVRQGLGVKDVTGNLDEGFGVRTDAGTFQARFVVGAYGKRSRLDRKLGRSFLTAARPDIGFKAHFTGSMDTEAVELHAYEGGYCGLCPLGHNVVNACWIGSEAALRASGGDPDRMLQRMQ